MRRIRQTIPDGRPLYAYKCRGKEYEELKKLVQEQIDSSLKGWYSLRWEPIFCLYAAETWRRKHQGGPWKWETVFDEIGFGTPPHSRIQEWVLKGLNWWRRNLLTGSNGHREFLVTIACEGGLPLRLLHKENASLNRHFRELLNEYRERKNNSAYDMTELARRLATLWLSASLRQDIVFNLSGQLIRSVVSLQEQVVDSSDPIAALNQRDPNWWNSLPLPVEDETVEALLGNLVRQAKDLAHTEKQRLRWRRILIQRNDVWTIGQQLELPNTVTGKSLKDWTGWLERSIRPPSVADAGAGGWSGANRSTDEDPR